jgi:polyferredoxin
MDSRIKNQQTDAVKVTAITALFAASVLIMLLGAGFAVYSYLYDVYFLVMNNQIHGAVFGIVIIFLGARYFLSVQKLKGEVYKSISRFSWGNFRVAKATKNPPSGK